MIFALCSVKFMNKIRYVHSLEELEQIVPMDHVHVPECVVQYVLNTKHAPPERHDS